MTPAPLDEQARAFAENLSHTVAALAPSCSPFRATTLSHQGSDRVSIRQDPETGIPLSVSGAPLLTLLVRFHCALDGQEKYLAVDKSMVTVHAGAKAAGEPMFRYEYVREVRSDIPSAHIQIHAHRDAFTHVMSRAGDETRRGRRRAQSDSVPELKELHFPVGGHRFRPCLEDVLEMLVTELGVDCSPDGRQSLRAGREVWRRTQDQERHS